MNKFWKGAFSPIRKHITEIRFVPFEQMGQEDWSVLDYGFLDDYPRAVIDKQIVDGDLPGFFQVNYDLHKATPHGGKPRYYYPGRQEDVARFANDDLGTEQFTNFNRNLRTQPPVRENFAANLERLSRLDQATAAWLAGRVLYNAMQDAESPEDAENAEDRYQAALESEYEHWREISDEYAPALIALREINDNKADAIAVARELGMEWTEDTDFAEVEDYLAWAAEQHEDAQDNLDQLDT